MKGNVRYLEEFEITRVLFCFVSAAYELYVWTFIRNWELYMYVCQLLIPWEVSVVLVANKQLSRMKWVPSWLAGFFLLVYDLQLASSDASRLDKTLDAITE